MSKYIDVAEGDVFGADASLCQMRGSMFRNFEVGGVTGWLKSGKHTDNTALRPVSRKDAELMIRMAGYTITAEFNATRDRERIRTLEAELAEAKADRDLLAIEVLAVRNHDNLAEPGRISPPRDQINEARKLVNDARVLYRTGDTR